MDTTSADSTIDGAPALLEIDRYDQWTIDTGGSTRTCACIVEVP